MTVFTNLDLSKVIGLESLDHHGPSHISMDTFILSAGRIPEVFLRGCGLSDADIQYAKLSNPSLSKEEITKILQKIDDLRAAQALQVSPLFISYSRSDTVFVDKVEGKLNEKGIRFWRDIHEAEAGRVDAHIRRAIGQYPKVLLILSEHSAKSVWVEQELQEAKKLESEIGSHVLCPVTLDDSWQSSHWSKHLVEYNILDFSAWKDSRKFEDTFRELIVRLELFHKG